jgi:Reverse transcriptase (RNA-dependent DNA polymerase)/gag-polyprotein putative aspartyl protease
MSWPFIPVYVNGSHFCFLLDSGSMENILSVPVADKLNDIESQPLEPRTFTLADGSNLTATATKTIPVSVYGGFKVSVTFFVLHIRIAGILGRTFLEDNQISLDFDKRSLNFQNCQVGQHSFLLQHFTDVFPTDLPHGLPPERPVEVTIQLRPDSKIVAKQPYKTSFRENILVDEFISDMLAKNFIRPSLSEFSAPVFFVEKKSTTKKRLVVDFRGLNKQIVPQFFPVPNVEDVLNALRNSHYFSKLDLRSGYYQVRIKPEDQPLTAFGTRRGLFQFQVLPMGLSISVAVFQRLMTTILV